MSTVDNPDVHEAFHDTVFNCLTRDVFNNIFREVEVFLSETIDARALR